MRSLLRPLVALAIFLFFFATPPGQHLFFAATDLFGRWFANSLVHSIRTSPVPTR